MTRILQIIGVVALLGLPMAASATDVLNPASPPSAPATNEAPKTDARTSRKEPETLWLVRCDDLKEKGKYCEAFQNLSVRKKEKEPARRVAEFAIGYGGVEQKKKAQAAIILPLGVRVNEALVIEVDGKEEAEAEIRYCEVSGCYAFTELSEGTLRKMGKGQKIMIKGKAANGKNLHIVMGLKGFGAALAQLKN